MTITAQIARTFKEKSIGLMFTDHINPLYLETRFGIHTFFVKHPIIVLILDSHNVVQYKKTIKPWSTFFWNLKYFRILELPADNEQFRKIKVSQKIDLVLT